MCGVWMKMPPQAQRVALWRRGLVRLCPCWRKCVTGGEFEVSLSYCSVSPSACSQWSRPSLEKAKMLIILKYHFPSESYLVWWLILIVNLRWFRTTTETKLWAVWEGFSRLGSLRWEDLHMGGTIFQAGVPDGRKTENESKLILISLCFPECSCLMLLLQWLPPCEPVPLNCEPELTLPRLLC